MHLAAFGLFAAALIVCVILNVSVIYALLAGLLIFSLCAFKMGYGAKSIFKMMLDGIKTAKNVILSLILIGMLTALWRAAGTIPGHHQLCSIAYTSQNRGAHELYTKLRCFTADRHGLRHSCNHGRYQHDYGYRYGCRPGASRRCDSVGCIFRRQGIAMSTSALLVSELTETNVFSNIRGMLRRSLIPFIVCCVLYTLAGISLHSGGDVPDLSDLFSQELQLHWLCLIPAVLVIVMSVFKIRVQITMTVSIISAAVLCSAIQKFTATNILGIAAAGFHAQSSQVAALLDGGGIASMLRSIAIIIVSSTYAGIFSGTGMLGEIRERIQASAE